MTRPGAPYDYLLHHSLRSGARKHPEKEAIVCGEERLAYARVWRDACSLAHHLRELGVARGDRVGIYMDARASQAVAIFAISRAGAVFVPINELLFPEQVAHIAKDCGLRALITSSAKLERVEELLSLTPVSLVIVDGDGDGDGHAETLPSEVLSYRELVSSAPSDPGSDRAVGKDLAALIYTSGSTGRAKGVMLSHEQIRAGAAIVSDYLSIDETDRTLAALPFSFDAGLNQLMTGVFRGATVIIKSFVFARELVQTLVEERITGMGGVPTLWSLLAQPSSSLSQHQLPELRYISNTGGALPLPVLRTLQELLPTTQVFLMYGLTEAFRSTYLPPEEVARRPTSMGHAIPNTEIMIVDDDGALCGPDEVGELVHRGPTVSMGYWGQPELTEKMLRPHPHLPPELGRHEHVVYSGDLVKKDEDGFLYFVARRDGMIKSSGYRVSPTEVELVLFQSDAVAEVAVIGVPDERLGQSIKAFVVAAEGTTLDVESLAAHCAEHLPRHMIPRDFSVLDALPKTGSRKVDYPELRRLHDDGA